MPLAKIKRRESVPGQGIAKLKRREQKTVYCEYSLIIINVHTAGLNAVECLL